MGLRQICVLVLLLAVTVYSNPLVKRGSCLSLCGKTNGVNCPSGYECQGNGCGHQCYRTTFTQPQGCPVMKCEYECPLGYVRDNKGCERCTCDYSALQKQGSTRFYETKKTSWL